MRVHAKPRARARARLGAFGALAAWIAAASAAGQAPGTDQLPRAVRDLDVIEHLGGAIPLDLPLTDSDGVKRTIGDSFKAGRPVVLALAYYDCPVACPALLDAMVRGFNTLESYTLGKDYDALIVSFDPTNTPEMAAQRKELMLSGYQPPAASVEKDQEAIRAGLTVSVTTADASRALADALGFQYRYLKDADEYAHPTVIFVATPDGRVARYLYGFDFGSGNKLKLALLEASEGRIAKSIGDKILMFCFHYDPKAGTYSLAAFRIMQVCAIAGVVSLAGLVGTLRLIELRRVSTRATAGPGMGLRTGESPASQTG